MPSHCKGRDYVLAVPPCLPTEKQSATQKDDNGITGPDWGRSELVFGCFFAEVLPPNAPLSVAFHSLLVSSTFLDISLCPLYT